MMRIRSMRIMHRVLAGIGAAVLAATLAVGSILPGYAATSNADTGTLTVIPKAGDEELTSSNYDGTFKIYLVATGAETGSFQLTDDFKDSKVELSNQLLSDAESFKKITEAFTNYLDAHSGIQADQSGIKAGDTLTLPYGLYLVHQDQSATGYTDASPFLIMIPQYSEGKTETNVKAYPKVTKVVTPPDVPDEPKPNDPESPKPPKYGKVALGKSDAVTGKALQGVVFDLYKANDTKIGSYTTDEQGIIYVDKLPFGEYYFIETKALDGYIVDTTKHTFTISSETDTVRLVLTNTPVPVVEEPATENTPGAFTGDNSNMTAYGIVAVIAAGALIGWFVWRRRAA